MIAYLVTFRISLLLSVLSLMALTIDRLLAIVIPFKHRNIKNTHVTCVCFVTWVITIIICSVITIDNSNSNIHSSNGTVHYNVTYFDTRNSIKNLFFQKTFQLSTKSEEWRPCDRIQYKNLTKWMNKEELEVLNQTWIDFEGLRNSGDSQIFTENFRYELCKPYSYPFRTAESGKLV